MRVKKVNNVVARTRKRGECDSDDKLFWLAFLPSFNNILNIIFHFHVESNKITLLQYKTKEYKTMRIYAQTTLPAYLLLQGELRRPKLTRHDMLRFYRVPSHGHLLNIVPIQGR